MSTRYCNFSKDKFDNQVSFCKPSWLNLNTGKYELILNPDKAWDHCIAGDGYLRYTSNIAEDVSFLEECLKAEIKYKNLISIFKYSAQQAREILPLCTATEAVYTGFAEDWKHFLRLRYLGTTGAPHPNMKELATKIYDICIKNNIIAEDELE
jgi:thymidylate synthase (FAD)